LTGKRLHCQVAVPTGVNQGVPFFTFHQVERLVGDSLQFSVVVEGKRDKEGEFLKSEIDEIMLTNGFHLNNALGISVKNCFGMTHIEELKR